MRLRNNYTKLTENNTAFTIVELLVVIVVIGILASITIVSYTGISQKAKLAAVESDLSNAHKKIKLFQVENESYPGSVTDCPSPAASNLCLKASGNGSFSYSVNNSVTPKIFTLIETSGDIQYQINQEGEISQVVGGPAVAGPLYPSSSVDDSSVGTKIWNSPTEAIVDNGTFTVSYGSVNTGFVKDYRVRIVRSNGTIGVSDRAQTSTEWSTTSGVVSYGSSSDLWGETWSSSDINDSDFGVVLSVLTEGDTNAYSHYLKVSNFGFNIPAGATINGITVNIKKKKEQQGNVVNAQVDSISISVNYTT